MNMTGDFFTNSMLWTPNHRCRTPPPLADSRTDWARLETHSEGPGPDPQGPQGDQSSAGKHNQTQSDTPTKMVLYTSQVLGGGEKGSFLKSSRTSEAFFVRLISPHLYPLY